MIIIEVFQVKCQLNTNHYLYFLQANSNELKSKPYTYCMDVQCSEFYSLLGTSTSNITQLFSDSQLMGKPSETKLHVCTP